MLNHYEFRSKSTFTTSFLNTAIDICIIFISKDTYCIISHTYYGQPNSTLISSLIGACDLTWIMVCFIKRAWPMGVRTE